MATNNEKLERFTTTVLRDANAVAFKIKKEIDQEYDQALKEAEDRCLAETFKYVKEEIAKIKTNEGKRISKKLLDSKRALFLRRSQVAQDVFAELKQRLADYVKTPAYEQRLVSLSREAAGILGDCHDIVVYLRADDLHLAQTLAPVFSQQSPAEFLKGSFKLGGLIVESKSKAIRIDESFDLAVSEQFAHYTERFGLSLAEL